MANKTPVKAIYTGTDTTALGEFAATDTVGVAHGGTGLSTVPAGALLYASALDTIAARAIGTAGTVLKSDGAAPAWGSLAVDDLSDVVVTTPAEGHVLTWDATNSRWRNEAQTGGVDTAANFDWTGQHTWTQNLGIGITTLGAWHNTYRALEWAGAGIMGNNATAGQLYMMAGLRFDPDGNFKYKFASAPAAAYGQADGAHTFWTAPGGTAGSTAALSTALKINNAGNVGIGTTDIEAWASTQRVLEFYGASVMASAAGSDLVANSNAYLDGAGYKYKRSGVAARHYLSDGTFAVQVAPSGTADTAITWTTALEIKNAGATQAGRILRTTGNSGAGESGSGAEMFWTGSEAIFAGRNPGVAYLPVRFIATDFKWDNGLGSEFLRINSGGNLGIGTTDIEAWNNNLTVMQGAWGALAFHKTAPYTHLTANAWVDGPGTWNYQGTGYASRIAQENGAILCQVAPSGTADTAITWTTALEITNAAHLKLLNNKRLEWGATAAEAYVTGVGNTAVYIGVGGTDRLVVAGDTSFEGNARPITDNLRSCGTSTQRWTAVYAVNGTIQTSTGAEKELGAEVTAAEALEAIRATPVRRFTYANDPGYDYTITKRGKQVKGKRKHRHVGVVLEDLPDWMRTTDTGLNPMSLAGLALAGVRAVDEELTALRARVAALEAA